MNNEPLTSATRQVR